MMNRIEQPFAPLHLPPDAEAASFAEPWQVEVFCLAIAAHQSRLFDWTSWVGSFSKYRDPAAIRDEPGEQDYFVHWLNNLEDMLTRLDLVSRQEIDDRVQAWRMAYLSTPHGQPVELAAGLKALSDPRCDRHHQNHDDTDHHGHDHRHGTDDDHDHDHDPGSRRRPEPVTVSAAR